MSYDVYLTQPATDRCEHCGRNDPGGVVYEANMTSNISTIWYRSLLSAVGKEVPTLEEERANEKPDPLGAFSPIEGMTGREAIPVLLAAAAHIGSNPAIYRPFEPTNGWGSCESAAKFLRDLANAWSFHPEAIFTVSR